MADVVFVDLETTGLDPSYHQIWEMALIRDEVEYVWHLPVDLAKADPNGLRVGRFYERWTCSDMRAFQAVGPPLDPGNDEIHDERRYLPARLAWHVARLLDGRHLVGAVPSFDAAFLTRWLHGWGQQPTWHYHLIDVEALTVGWIARALYDAAEGTVPRQPVSSFPLPWDSEALSIAVGVEPDQFDRHTALGDARWAKAIYEKVCGAD